MRNFFKPFVMASTVAALFFVSSCTKTCDPGYEGSDCKTEVRAKMLGNYTASETKNGGTPYNYSGSILTSSGDVQEVFINRIPNGTGFFSTNVKATVDGNSLTIANQNPDGDNYYITGVGAFSETSPAKVVFTYTVTGPNSQGTTVTDSYVATWTKQ